MALNTINHVAPPENNILSVPFGLQNSGVRDAEKAQSFSVAAYVPS